ncbi:unnamed protein product [Diatraea saccharalis]|uniref:G-protein coupled receptors family 3 profile domain-containing protein n=1 Tax=Diatraea saccharalis TaxID=40085 RepID=A0A9N9WBK3_9NEOP|nr:unnamed protein product [Diatraea saccharalis]
MCHKRIPGEILLQSNQAVDPYIYSPSAIIFGSDQEVAGVMRAVERGNATSLFSWVGSDGWSARTLVSDGNERAVEGTISVQPQANDVRGFTEYFLGLNVKNNRRNPWFIELWEAQFQCRYPGSPRTPYNGHFERACSGHERLTVDNTEFERQLQFVSDAVLAFAYAIRNGDGPARYNILHFKQVQQNVYRWVNVGQYLDGELQLDLDNIQFKWYERRPPESVCSAECELGQAKQYVEGESCCWHCFNCTQYEIRSPFVETACMVCPRGALPDATRTHCRPIPEAYLRPDSAWAIGAMSFSSVGILLTAFVCGVWVRHSSTPVVRASGRELSYVLLAGILMCYLVTFALVFGTGFCFTVVYAALLTKTNRISRIFNASKHSAKRPILISPSSQLAICAALVSIQYPANHFAHLIFNIRELQF